MINNYLNLHKASKYCYMFGYNKELVHNKYYEMKKAGIEVDFLDQVFGQIKIFINALPEHEFFSVNIEGDIVSIGTD